MKDLIIIGCGGLGREALQYIRDINLIDASYNVIGFIDDNLSLYGSVIDGIKVLGDTDTLADLKDVSVFCAIATPSAKEAISLKLDKRSMDIISILHPTAYISPSVSLGRNVLIGPLCVLTTSIKIGDFVHINPQCGIGHDTQIDDFTTLYWDVSIGGGVKIGKSCQLGSKTFVKQRLFISDGVISGAGSVIVKDVAANRTVKGVPAI